jgi:TatD DNase family protein
VVIVDSHCHLDRLDLKKYDGDLNQAIQYAQSMHVQHMLCVCIDLTHFAAVQAIAKRYPNVHASVGVHPTEPNHLPVTTNQLIALAKQPKIVAIGETGLDYFHCKGDVTWQQQRFRHHIAAAIATKKPLIIHTREARDDTIRIMREENAHIAGGVMHCFTETLEMAEAAMEMGFYISFSGIITFKNATELQELVRHIPLEKMLIETDSPYLAPAPHRGKSNEPAFTYYVAQKIADLKGICIEQVAQQTTQNYFDLFKTNSETR